MFEQALTSNVQNGHAWLCMTVFVLYIKLHDYRQKRAILPLTNGSVKSYAQKYLQTPAK